MNRDADGKERAPERPDADGPVSDQEREAEERRHEAAKREAACYEPTAEELREAEPVARDWQERARERRRALLGEHVPNAMLPTFADLADKSREWLLMRLSELRRIAQGIPGGVAPAAHLNLDGHGDGVPTDEIRSQVAELERAIALANGSGRSA